MYMSKLFVLHIWHYKTKHLGVYFIKNPFLLNKWKKRVERGNIKLMSIKLIDHLLMETAYSILTNQIAQPTKRIIYYLHL